MEYLLSRASSFAVEVDNLILLIAVLSGFWLIVAEFVLFYFCFRYRRGRQQKALYVSGEVKKEKQWVLWPHYIVIVFDIVIVAFAAIVWIDVKQTLPEPDQTVSIVAQQWAWRMIHPGKSGELGSSEDIVMVDELHVKLGAVYHFKLRSDDVLHCFSVPVFRLKQDAIPGREITGWFKATKEGEYDIQCAEMCGVGHGVMGAKLFVHNEVDYESWRKSQLKSIKT